VTIAVGIALRRDSGRPLSLVVDDRITELAGALRLAGHGDPGPESIDQLLTDWGRWGDAVLTVARILRDDPERVSWERIEAVDLDPPLGTDPLLLFAAANYADHTREAEASPQVAQVVGGDGRRQPYLFQKPRRSVVGPTDAVVKPVDVDQLDWEVELAVVIGIGGRRIPADRAMDHVAGYVLCNDVSARDHVRRPDWPMFSSDWFAQKGYDTFTPLGPVLVPAAAVADPYALRLRLWVDDDLVQDGCAGDMVFDVADQIAHASRFCTLRPGDVISTGTPAGVGMATGRFLSVGSRMVAEIDGLGCQRTPVKAEEVADVDHR
jgi:2-keto-4-pentenoate hydratase/2-oxohepta-3-ene-1,7-dioic acid hydratase in catechol pathway